jgi:hypothetical protein
MQCDSRRALGFGDLARLEVGVVLVVDADPVFDGHRDVGALGAPHRGVDDLAE